MSDELMPLFFVVIILEIKKKIIFRYLSSLKRIALPLGAWGRMIVPTLTYRLVAMRLGFPCGKGCCLHIANHFCSRPAYLSRTWHFPD
ncbi:Na+/H+ antiporter NhaA [Zymomonas mobilis]